MVSTLPHTRLWNAIVDENYQIAKLSQELGAGSAAMFSLALRLLPA
jgi:hypothetical protein